MNFVDKEHIPVAKIGQDSSQITGAFDSRSGCDADAYTQFPGNDVCQGCFAETGWTVEQNMVKRFFSLQSSLDIDSQFFLDLLLANILLQAAWPETDLDLGVIIWLTLG